ncbi:MAG: hypothetical protein N2595_04700 [bacterium]|nr:hypothetical protein [bacterium]
MRVRRGLLMLGIVSWLMGVTNGAHAGDHTLLKGLGRGVANLVVGWLEIPQCLTYYAVEYPVIGVVPGALQGAGMTVVRAFGGVIDLVTVGYLAPGNTVYDAVEEPLLPWEGAWLPTQRGE